MWNLNNKQNRNKLIDSENILMVARGEADFGMGEKGERIKRCKLPLIKIVTGRKLQHGEYSR